MHSPIILGPTGAKKLAEQIREIGKRARSEEDVRLNIEHALRPVLEKLGITTQAAYEQPLTLLQGTGRADAVYGFGIIEFERPGELAAAAGRKEVVEQCRVALKVGKECALKTGKRSGARAMEQNDGFSLWVRGVEPVVNIAAGAAAADDAGMGRRGYGVALGPDGST